MPWLEQSSELAHAECGDKPIQKPQTTPQRPTSLNPDSIALYVTDLLQECFGEKPLARYKEGQPKCKIELLDRSTMDHLKLEIPVREPVRPCSKPDIEEFAKQTPELLEMGLIQESKSPCPAFMVRKNAEIVRGKPRMVVDYKKLNVVVVKDAYPRLHNRFQ